MESRRKTAKKATQDIVCYKIVRKRNGEYIPLNNLCQTTYKIGEVMEASGETKVRKDSIGRKYYIEGGMFHTLQNLSDVSAFGRIYKHLCCCDIYLCKCIIPKGSLYYEGKSLGYKIYASRHLLIIEDLGVR